MSKASCSLEKIYSNLGDINYDFRNKNLYALILKRVSGDKVLDVGCGAGHLINLMLQKGIEASGIELDRKLINLSKKNYGENFPVENIRAENLSLVKERFNTITIIDVLEHLKDDVLVLKRIRNKLSKNGRVIIVVPAYPYLLGKRDIAIGHFRRYSKKELQTKLQKNGFLIKEIRFWNALGLFPYFLSEKVLKKELSLEIRKKGNKNLLQTLMSKALFFWFKNIENNFNFGFGLSIICVAELDINNN